MIPSCPQDATATRSPLRVNSKMSPAELENLPACFPFRTSPELRHPSHPYRHPFPTDAPGYSAYTPCCIGLGGLLCGLRPCRVPGTTLPTPSTPPQDQTSVLADIPSPTTAPWPTTSAGATARIPNGTFCPFPHCLPIMPNPHLPPFAPLALSRPPLFLPAFLVLPV